MHDAHAFLLALTIVLGVAAVTTVICQRLKQPVVLGYILAGLVIGPHVPVPLVADTNIVGTLSELGVILLMFSIGLEFSPSRLAEVGATAGVTAVIQCSLMAWLGFVVARFFGWTTMEGLFTGAVIAISSTTIIAKAFDEQKIGGNLRKLVFGILIVEDLVGIFLMAALTAIASGAGLSARALALTTARLGAFLVGLLVVGLLVVPRSFRAIVRMNRPETTLVASIGLCFGVALLAQEFGYSVALGAFIAGSLIGESGVEKEVEHLVTPVRDMFAAIFFVSVGMSINPSLIAAHFPAVATLTAVVIAGKVVGVSLGAFLSGAGPRTSIEAGMSLAQIGEFSFIIAGLGLTLRATGDFIYPIAVAVSGITTLLTPWLIRGASRFASFVDRLLPGPMQTFASLYGTWLETLRSGGSGSHASKGRIRRLIGSLVLDGALLAALVIGVSITLEMIAARVGKIFDLSPEVARPIVIGAAVVLALPFVVGIARVSRRLGLVLAAAALPERERKELDLARAPRRVLVLTLELAILLLVGTPLVAITEPFLPGFWAASGLFVVLVALGFVFWRRTADLEGHVRAGARMIVELLASQANSGKDEGRAPLHLGEVDRVLPGLGAPVPVLIEEGSPAVGKSLADLNLRGATGATVLVITRGPDALVVPAAAERLHAGDVVALAGTKDAVEAARALLGCPALAPTPS